MSQSEWGVPDWRDAAAYPKPNELSERLWRWEFIRRMSDYREAWDRASKVEYEMGCRSAENTGKDESQILYPGNLYFVVNTAAFENPGEYPGLFKYHINPFFNPRLGEPRLFKAGPLRMRLPAGPYEDEQGGYFLSRPRKEHWHGSIMIRPGWTIVHFDLTEPLDNQLARAKKRLEEQQAIFTKEVGISRLLKEKTARRRRRSMWPIYLRVLDARDAGVSYRVIGQKLKNHTDAERARVDAKKWHDAALKVANSW